MNKSAAVLRFFGINKPAEFGFAAPRASRPGRRKVTGIDSKTPAEKSPPGRTGHFATPDPSLSLQ
jgi:hypothetical protein